MSFFGLALWQGVLAGIIASAIIWLFVGARRLLMRKGGRIIFGQDFSAKGSYRIVFSELQVRNDLLEQNATGEYKPVTWPLFVNNDRKWVFRVSALVGLNEVRAANYLNTFFAKKGARVPLLASALDVACQKDMSWISLGGPKGNKKSEQTQDSQSNEIAYMHRASAFLSKQSKKIICEANEDSNDYGLIVRVQPREHPERVWIACMGLGESGTEVDPIGWTPMRSK